MAPKKVDKGLGYHTRLWQECVSRGILRQCRASGVLSLHRMEGTGTYKEENKVQHVQWTRCQWLMPSHNFRVVLSTFRTLKESGSPSGFSGYYEDRKCRVGRYVMVDARKHNTIRVVRVVERKTRAYKVTRSELICRDAESFAEELTMPRCICMYFFHMTDGNLYVIPVCSQ